MMVTKKGVEFKACGCGCGEPVSSKSNYKPGHDARHAGVVGREIAANYTTKGFDRRVLLAVLPSDALRAKAERVAEKVINTGVVKPAKAAKAEIDHEGLAAKVPATVQGFTHGTVKVIRAGNTQRG